MLIDGVEDVEEEGFWGRGKKTAVATDLEESYCSADRGDQAAN